MTCGNQNLANMVKFIAEAALKRNANQTTCNIVYQPRVPEKLNRYKKAK